MKTLNGSSWLRLISGVMLTLAISGCQSTGQTGQMTTVSTASGCNPGTSDAEKMAPPGLYNMMAGCIKTGDLDSAVYLYALAGSRTTYDARRVNTQYAYSMHNRTLKEALDNVDSAQKEKFWSAVQANLAEPDKKARICSSLKSRSAPAYAPSYMRLDASAVDKSYQADQKLWESSVKKYIECL